jgi:phage gp36-like protein
MAYATVQDLIDRFGEAEVKQLAPAATPALGFDQARLSGALDDASAEADSYLAVRWTPSRRWW